MTTALQDAPFTTSPTATVSVPFTAIEYFAGIGLFRMGLQRAGWSVEFANDWSEERAQMYGGFFGDTYEVKDVFSVSHEQIPHATLATCSFPCIDLSLAGKQEGIHGKHSGAFWGFHELLSYQGSESPPIVLLENVPGWLYTNGGGDFYATAEALNDLGYACDVFMLNARAFVPQSRPRIFMVGAKIEAAKTRSAHTPHTRSKRLMPAKLKELVDAGIGVDWMQLDIPEPPPDRNEGFSSEIVEELPEDSPRWWPEEKVQKHLDMMSPSHLDLVRSLANRDDVSCRTFFRRRRAEGQRAEVRSDDIAGCLRTAVGGSGKQFMVSVGQGIVRMRTLTAREYARLQGVPDEYSIVANSERQSLSAFGDAVCVPAVTWIANEVLIPLTEGLSNHE